MAHTLNFNNVKKRYFTVTLADASKTTLLISTPTKEIMDELVSMNDSLTATAVQKEVTDDLYEICTKIMNHNKGGIKVAKKDIEKMLDFEDIILFIESYTEFINEVVSLKN